jgi:phage terminase large subunit
MNFEVGKIFNGTLTAMRKGKRVIACKGGTRSGKTWGLLQLCYTLAMNKPNVLVSVVGESVPFLKRGAMRDFKTMLGNDWREEWWNATDKVYTFPATKSSIEFFSADNIGKVHGSSRDYLFINECYFILYETFRQLAVRTRKTIFLDYNPRSRFWVDENLLDRESTELIHSTYRDNPFLSAEQIAEIESNRSDANWWRVYGEGETGSVEGLIYTNWDIVDAMPESRHEYIGIDFGFTNDPTAILRVVKSGGELYVDELCYRRGYDNTMIARLLKDEGCNAYTDIVADSAEPKSIREINAYGLNCKPVTKSPDSILNGIQVLQRYKLHVTKRSIGTINELRNYSWKQDVNGNYINKPVGIFDHAMDALRYVGLTYLDARPRPVAPRANVVVGNEW